MGIVILQAVIGPTGKVTNIEVLRSASLLDDAAIRAVRQWLYSPTLLNGTARPGHHHDNGALHARRRPAVVTTKPAPLRIVEEKAPRQQTLRTMTLENRRYSQRSWWHWYYSNDLREKDHPRDRGSPGALGPTWSDR